MSDEYGNKLHAVQTGIAMEIEIGKAATSPKHLRVGINSAMCDHAALVRLLIEKGVITAEEYITEIEAELDREIARYEERLSEHFGKTITLG